MVSVNGGGGGVLIPAATSELQSKLLLYTIFLTFNTSDGSRSYRITYSPSNSDLTVIVLDVCFSSHSTGGRVWEVELSSYVCFHLPSLTFTMITKSKAFPPNS